MKHKNTALVLSTLVVLAAALRAEAQDRIIFTDGHTMECKVISLSFKEVRYQLGGESTQDEKSRLVKDIEWDRASVPFEYEGAKQAFNGNDFATAIDKFQKMIRDSRTSEPVKDYCRRYVAESLLAKRDFDGLIAFCENLRKEKPESFFLKDSFLWQYEAAKTRGNAQGQKDVMEAFKKAASEKGMSEWNKNVDLISADALEATKDYEGALRIYEKYAKDADVSTNAMLGILRCLTSLNKAADLKSRAQGLIDESKGDAKKVSPRLLIAAFTARGDALLAENKPKEALLDFMWCVLELGPRLGEFCREHEAALAKSGIAAAKVAKTFGDKDKENKTVYIGRALEQLGELDKTYPGTPWKRVVDEAIREAQRGQ